MVERISAVLFDDGTLGVEGKNFESGTEGVHEHCKEEYCTTLEERIGGLFHVVEDGSDDEGHDDVTEELSKGQTGVTLQTSESSPKAELDLLGVREGVRRLATSVLRLLGTAGVQELLGLLTADGVFLVIDLNILEQLSTLRAVLPASGELFRGSRDLVLKAWAHHALLSRCHGSEEIGVSLTIRAHEAHSFEEATRLSGDAEEDLVTLVQHDDLVEHVVGCLRSLVDSDHSRGSAKLGGEAQSLAELDGVGRVQTTRTVVPSLERSSTECCLGNGHTLALTTGDTANEIVTDHGVDSVADAECRHHHVTHVLRVDLSAHAAWDVPWGSRPGSKVQCVTDCQHREVDINFSSVNGFTAVVAVHLFG